MLSFLLCLTHCNPVLHSTAWYQVFVTPRYNLYHSTVQLNLSWFPGSLYSSQSIVAVDSARNCCYNSCSSKSVSCEKLHVVNLSAAGGNKLAASTMSVMLFPAMLDTACAVVHRVCVSRYPIFVFQDNFDVTAVPVLVPHSF